MKYLKYSDLIFIASEVAHLTKQERYKEAIAQLNELNPLQAIYAFSWLRRDLSDVEIALLMSRVETAMNREAIAKSVCCNVLGD